jgi:hypothetical protein
MGRRGRRCNQLLDDLKEKMGHLELKEDTLDRTLLRKRSVSRDTHCRMNIWWTEIFGTCAKRNSVEIKECSYTCNAPLCLQGVDTSNYSFTLTF